MRSDAPPREPAPDGGADWGPSYVLLAVATVLVGGALGYAVHLWTRPDLPATAVVHAAAPAAAATPAPVQAPPAGAPSAAPAPVATLAAPAPAAAPRIPRQRDPDGDQTPDLADYVNPGEVPTMADVISRLRDAGVTSGLGAFQPPGTRPPLIGLAVPEGFPLPEGYVRHHQATDDGQRIEPILMFAPDRPFFDAAGNPVAIPQDRVVPPELAPPGMGVRFIRIPAPAAEPGR